MAIDDGIRRVRRNYRAWVVSISNVKQLPDITVETLYFIVKRGLVSSLCSGHPRDNYKMNPQQLHAKSAQRLLMPRSAWRHV